jgi:hypothetical protein
MSDVAIYKSTAAEFIDDFFSGDGATLRENLEYALRLLDQDDTPLSAIIDQFSEDRQGPNYEKTPPKWLQGADVDRVMKHGYKEAIRLALSHDDPVPIETLWITGAARDFEMHICDGKRLVTVLLSIPVVKEYGSKRASARSVVFGVGDRQGLAPEAVDNEGAPVLRRQVSGRQT